MRAWLLRRDRGDLGLVFKGKVVVEGLVLKERRGWLRTGFQGETGMVKGLDFKERPGWLRAWIFKGKGGVERTWFLH